jgi:hypothetical protein
MSNAEYRVDGTPTWAVRRVVEIALLLPLGVLFVGMMASPALVLLSWYSSVAMTAGMVTVVWVGSLVGTQIARGMNDEDSTSDQLEAKQPIQALVALFALYITGASMVSAHVIGVSLITAEIAPMTSASIVLALPIAVSVIDMIVAQFTGYSIFAFGFGFAYVVLRMVEIAIDVDKGVFAEIGKPVLDLVTLPRRSFG